MRGLYAALMSCSAPFLRWLLTARARKGKEDPTRIHERMGAPLVPRPDGPLLWLHAASVGEAQSALILVNALLLREADLTILVTTGTVTSAQLMANRLPARTLHQYVPLDHPQWVANFLDHWQPDRVLWMESELWPHMLQAVKARALPAALINARLSPRSFRRWSRARGMIAELLSSFTIILAQTEQDAAHFRALGRTPVIVTDNLKYSAAPLPVDEAALKPLMAAIQHRPRWVYASTHDGEEELACRLHEALRPAIPDLLTIIVPRHPDRRDSIAALCKNHQRRFVLRSHGALPQGADEIYIADTMGELGLFYRAVPVACIGRSFSNDGGGGHNPIEAAQLDCAVLHGPNIQNLAALFAEMNESGAALRLRDEEDFRKILHHLLTDSAACAAQRARGTAFVNTKAQILDRVLSGLTPVLAAPKRTAA